jgi:hypothetical protein
MRRVYKNKQHHSPHKVPHRVQTNPICGLSLFSEPEPPWFQAAWQQLTADIINDMRLTLRAAILSELHRVCPGSFVFGYRLIQLLQNENLHRGDGTVIPYYIVPFADGTDPIGPPVGLLSILTTRQQANS